MTRLIEYLSDHLSQELTAITDSSAADSLRVFFSGPPQEQLSKLFKLLTTNNSCMVLETVRGRLEVPVYLIDQNAEDPREFTTAARCTPSYLVQIRNRNQPVFLALHEVGASTNASLITAVKPLGIPTEILRLEDWSKTTVVNELIEKCLSALFGEGSKDNAKSALDFALLEAWNEDDRYRDKPTAWRLLERLAELRSESAEPYESLAAVLGLTSCRETELGSKNHLATLGRLADMLQSRGLRTGFDELEENASDDIRPHVHALRDHLDGQKIFEAGEFAKCPLKAYSPLTEGAATIPEWWKALSIDAWAQLLDAGSEPEPASKLRVTPHDLLAAVTRGMRGMPMLVRDRVEFDISIGEAKEAIQVSISRARGQATLQEVDRIVVKPRTSTRFTDADVPEHERFVRYKLEAPGHAPRTIKFIVLDHYLPGVVAHSRGATRTTPFRMNRKAKDSRNRKLTRYECELQLPSIGLHQLDLFVSARARLGSVIKGYEVDAEHSETLERPVNSVDANHYGCLVETDEECHYEFEVDPCGEDKRSTYRIYLTADEGEPAGATSEFDRLVLAHRAAARHEHSHARVEPATCRATNLEEWALESDQSFRPLVLGPDYLDHWRKPAWEDQPLLSGLPMPIDPRPVSRDLKPPQEFVSARKNVLEYLRTPSGEPTPAAGALRLYELMRDPEFETTMREFLDAYFAWMESDYDRAAWIDITGIHAAQSGANALSGTPYAILLSPLHPIRLAWQCQAQRVLQQALDKHVRCPAASMFNPASFPDCMVLPCRTAMGTIERKPFAAMASSSDYWSVMWAVDSISRLGSNDDPVLGEEFGISVDGLTRGFSSQQVVRSLDEVARLLSAKSTLHIGVSSDTGGASSCNEGIDAWCSANLGPEHDHWQDAGPRSLVVVDRRDRSLQPEPAVLASLTSRTDAAVRWFVEQAAQNKRKNDLSIISHLGTMSHGFATQGIRSAIDPSSLTRWRVRKQLPSQNVGFIAESRIGEIPSHVGCESLAGALLRCVDAIERRCREDFDCYVFAPNMAVLNATVDDSWYTAVSSSTVDAACFFGATEKAYLWDYELPAYSRRAGENSGYFLLAKESPGMLLAVRSAIALLSSGDQPVDHDASALLEEISRRGMPTLKRLTAGGSMSLGEIGMLVAMRVFQSEFERSPRGAGLLSVKDDDETISLVIPADPFKSHFEDLRLSLENRQGERPDFLVLSLQFVSGTPMQMRITPVEVKARGGSMSAKDRTSALAQASGFAEFLSQVQDRGVESELWGIAWRSLLATLLDYGFRVYGQLEQFMQQDEWARAHSAVLRSLSSEELETTVDQRGRLIIVENTNASAQQDVDRDGFNETLVLSHADAVSMLSESGDGLRAKLRDSLGCWQLKPEPAPDTERRKAPDENTCAERVATNRPEEESPPASNRTPRGIVFPVGETVTGFTAEVVEFFPGNTALNQLNVGIVGDLGTGKTQLVQALVHQLRASPETNRGHRPNVLIFDYKKDYSKRDFVEATGARVVTPYGIPLNLFDTRDSLQKRNVWLERSRFFIDMLDKIYRGIGPVQRQKIKEAVKSSYEKATVLGKVAPTISDVFSAYKSAGGSPDAPYNIMDDLVDGGYFVSDASEVVPFSEFLKGVVVVDLAEVGQDDRTKNMLVVVFLNLFYEHMLRIQKKEFLGENPRVRFVDTMLLVDEADNIMKFEFEVLKKILLQGREFGVGVLLASQYLSHFKTAHENYLEPLLTWFVHKVPSISVKDLEGIGLTGVSIDTVERIKSMECHECLYKTLGVDGRIVRATPFFELREQRSS